MIVENGYQEKCPCGATIQVGICSDGFAGAAHDEPICDKFGELDRFAFLRWLQRARIAMPCAGVLARMEQQHAIGRHLQ